MANRPEITHDWVFAPILALVGIAIAGLVLSFTMAARPVVAMVGYWERRRSRDLRHAAIEQEDRELLEEVRRSRYR